MNCGTELTGPFCARCGQRAVGAYPTMRDIAGDAWQELSGWDGRFARTIEALRHPGLLTVEAMEGRRARYVSPVRLYLLASVVYFLCAATVPNLHEPTPAVMPGSNVNITIDGTGRTRGLSPEERAQALKDLERAPSWMQVVLRPVVMDPVGFRKQYLQTLPRVLFVLVPVFAAIVAVFYRRRRFPQHLVFAVHLHAAVFIVLTLRELAQLPRSAVLLGVVEVVAVVTIAWYALAAFRRVYGERWPRVLLKSAAIAFVYAIAGFAALAVTMVWTAIAV